MSEKVSVESDFSRHCLAVQFASSRDVSVNRNDRWNERQTFAASRIAGFFYLLVLLFNGSLLLLRDSLVNSGDAAATASNILAHASRFWLGLTCYFIMIACHVVVTVLFYELFKPVNRSVSLLAAFFAPGLVSWR